MLMDQVDKLEQADYTAREFLLQKLMKFENYWEGNQFFYWSSLVNDWRSPSRGDFGDPTQYDEFLRNSRVVNIYRSTGESIISALTSAVPSVKFKPDDADNPDDVDTARAYSTIAKLIQQFNRPKPLLKRALNVLFNQTFVAAYTYSEENAERFGESDFVVEEEEEREGMVCVTCGAKKEGEETCPECGSMLEGKRGMVKETVERVEYNPKTGQIIEIYGPRNVKIPMYVRKLKDSPYLMLEIDEHYMKCNADYPGFNFEPMHESSSRRESRYERETFDEPDEAQLCTKKTCWLRPWAVPAELRKEFPQGAKIIIINDELVAATPELIEDHWIIAENPLTTYLHGKAMGEDITDMQDTKNDIYNYTLNALAHSTPQTFADESVLNFDKYRQEEIRQGMLYPVTAPGDGTPISQAFFSLKAGEVPPGIHHIDAKNDRDTEVVSGNFPSVAGAPQDEGSKTLGEYQESRSFALQRLSLSWDIIKNFFADIMKVSVRNFVVNMGEADEHNVVEQQGHQYVNLWISKVQLSGRVGNVDAEASESFPTSTTQMKGNIISLLQYGGDLALQLLSSPNNLRKVFNVLGFQDFETPQSTQADKQLEEIAFTERHQMPAPVDPLADDHMVHFDTLRQYMTSDKGMHIKDTNPVVYQSLQVHLQQHLMAASMVQQWAESIGGGPVEEKPSGEQGAQPGMTPEQTGQQAPNAPAEAIV